MRSTNRYLMFTVSCLKPLVVKAIVN